MVGMVYGYIPFMILPLYATLVKMDHRLVEAAADLGSTPFKTFWLVTVPLSKSGIIAGSLLVFIPAVGEYVIPELLAGPSTLNIGRVMWNEFFLNLDWQRASAVAIVMIVLILLPIAVFNKYQTKSLEGCDEKDRRAAPDLDDPGLPVPLPAHCGAGGVFVQRFAHGHPLGRLDLQVVRRGGA
jgi:ABC-type spermidine/putrescine transport system, permease component I